MPMTQLLREYGAAIRGHWGDLDGRSVRIDLEQISDWIEDPETFPGVERARNLLAICPLGRGHWDYYCDERCTEGSL